MVASKATVGVGGGELQVEVRKGPWTKQEDVRLVWFVRLLGERRWDFLAKGLRFARWRVT